MTLSLNLTVFRSEYKKKKSTLLLYFFARNPNLQSEQNNSDLKNLTWPDLWPEWWSGKNYQRFLKLTFPEITFNDEFIDSFLSMLRSLESEKKVSMRDACSKVPLRAPKALYLFAVYSFNGDSSVAPFISIYIMFVPL